jgi:two-component system cell cycle response regulator DivK
VGQKILVVEDNELNLKLFCDLLRAHGYQTEPVRDGRDAVERARAFAPDLVVMDIQMPYVSGLELIEQMKSDDGLRRTPIMAVTAYAAKGDEERIRDAGAEGYVSKPISVIKFVEAVAGLLAAAAARPADPEPAAASAAPADPVESELADAPPAKPQSDETPAIAEQDSTGSDPADTLPLNLHAPAGEADSEESPQIDGDPAAAPGLTPRNDPGDESQAIRGKPTGRRRKRGKSESE